MFEKRTVKKAKDLKVGNIILTGADKRGKIRSIVKLDYEDKGLGLSRRPKKGQAVLVTYEFIKGQLKGTTMDRTYQAEELITVYGEKKPKKFSGRALAYAVLVGLLTGMVSSTVMVHYYWIALL